MGEPPTAQMNKALLLQHPLVASSPIFLNPDSWKMVSFIFKHKTSKKRMVASFRNFESSSIAKMKVRPGILNEMEFELHKIIIQKQNDSILSIRKPSIEDSSKYDFILGQFTTNTDFTPPSVVLSVDEVSLINSSLQLTVTFSEEVTGFNQSKLELTNATAMETTSVDNKVFYCLINPIQEGVVTVKVPAGCCTDLAGNSNSGSNTISFTYDISAPISNLSLSPILSTEYATASSFELLMEIGEEVQDLTISSFQLVNATLSLISKTGTNYLYSLTPSSDGFVSVKMSDGAIRDMAGNWVGESNTISFIYDSTAPQLSVVLPSPTITTSYANSAINVTVSMQDANPVALNDPGILTLTNATASFVSSSGTDAVFEITPVNQGLVTIKINANTITDAAGNANTESNTVSFTYDTVPPVITLASSPILSSSSTTVYDPFTVTATLAGYGTGLSPDGQQQVIYGRDLNSNDVLVLNGAITNFNKVSLNTYTFTVNPSSNGLGWVKINSGIVADYANNYNSESNLLAFNYVQLSDLIIPAGTITYTLNYGSTVYNEPYEYKNVTVPSGCTLLFDNYTVGQTAWARLIVRDTLTLNGTIKARTKERLDNLTLSSVDDSGAILDWSIPSKKNGGAGGSTSAGVSGGTSSFGNGGGGGWTWVQTFATIPSYAGGADSVSKGGNSAIQDTANTVIGGAVPGAAGANGNKSYTATGGLFNAQYKGSGVGGAGGGRGYDGSPLYVKAKVLNKGYAGAFDVSGQQGGKGGNGSPYGTVAGKGLNTGWGSGGGGGGAGGNGSKLIVEVGSMNGFFDSSSIQVLGGSGGSGGTSGAAGPGQWANNGTSGQAGSNGTHLIKGNPCFLCSSLSSTGVLVDYVRPDVKIGDKVRVKSYAGIYYKDANNNNVELTVSAINNNASNPAYLELTFSSSLPAGFISEGHGLIEIV